MLCLKGCYGVSTVIILLITCVALAPAAEPEKQYEAFDSSNFSRSSTVNNEWFPLKPGMRYVFEGSTIDEGEKEDHRVVFTVTDLTKVIDGISTVVCWDQDYADGELVEAEICFFAQDDKGNVWLMGEYPEEYEDGEFVAAPCWIHGALDGKAGIIMRGDPKRGTPSYSQGWAPSVEFSDRGVVYQVNQKTNVAAGTYDNVLVIDEFNDEEPNAHQLKFYGRGVGCIRIGWRGEVTDQEDLQLLKVEELGAEEMAKAREESLKLEERAYEISKDVYSKTRPSEYLGSKEAADTKPDATTSLGE